MTRRRWGRKFHEEEIPASMVPTVEDYREKILEMLAEDDDSVMERYLAGEPISQEETQALIRRETASARMVPVLCGSAFKNKGIQQLLDAVVDYLPSPARCSPDSGS